MDRTATGRCAKAGVLDRAVVRMHAAHPQLDAARAETESVTDPDLAGGGSTGHHQPYPGGQFHCRGWIPAVPGILLVHGRG